MDAFTKYRRYFSYIYTDNIPVAEILITSHVHHQDGDQILQNTIRIDRIPRPRKLPTSFYLNPVKIPVDPRHAVLSRA